MHIARLKISGFRGVRSADITLGRHTVLVGPNNSGKTTVIEALALLFGRDRLVRRLTEHDFHDSAPDEAARLLCIATVTGFTPNDPHHHASWFNPERGVEKWFDPAAKTLSAAPDAQHTDLAVQIGFAARFDLDELEAETIRFFVDDEATLGDPFAEDAHLRTIQTKVLQELGFFLVPASRTWDRWISFSSELFRRVVATRGDMPAQAVRAERTRLWTPPEGTRLEDQPGLSEIVGAANDELRTLMASAPKLQLRLTATDSDSVLESVVPHFVQGTGPTLPSQRQGTGLVSLQSLLLLMQFGKARAETGQSFVLAVEEPELHIQPSQQKRLVNRLNALCNQTIVTTHSPIVAAMFPAPDTLFIETREGVLNAKPLMDPVPAQPTNHQQHLLFAWRQKLVAALMHECVLIPEGVSDVAWLEALQTALELHQGWQDAGDGAPLFSTFVGVVPTIDAKIADTFALVRAVHARPCILVDGDNEGRGYFDAVKTSNPPPRSVVFWPQGWAMEHVVSWIAGADEAAMLGALGTALGQAFANAQALTAHLLTQKSYAPTQESVAITIMASAPCRTRAAQLLNAMCAVLRDPANANMPLFTRIPADSRHARLQVCAAMTFDFFEGAAGTGKTHNLVGRAGEIVQDGILGEGHKLLALTFMNGARRRLDARLGENPAFRRRFDCQTFDVFARTVAARRRSLITPAMQAQADALSEFDGPCALAAGLLENEAVQKWVARIFPLILVDEAQDLDEHRMRVLQGLSPFCRIVAAADAFQCLQNGRDTAPLMGWLEGAGQTHRLTLVRRTTQQGLLSAALAVRQGQDVKSVLTANTFNNRTTWNGAGFRLLDAPATNANHALLTWSIANDIAQRQGPVVILTPDAGNAIIRAALNTLQTKQHTRKNGATFGPYPHTWDRHDNEEANALLVDIALPETASCADLRALLTPLAGHAPIAQALNRMDRLRRAHGQTAFTATQVTAFVQDSVRNRSRLGFRQQRGHLVMTIQRAKNREFPNVIVLWPHTATGSAEHLRRLLYNGITRAQNHCTVIVLGQNRPSAPPFAPPAVVQDRSA